jgi:radical SAM protein with 4Fe4S-binding SPASM domain
MCGRRKLEREHPEIKSTYGDMDLALVKHIAKQVPDGTLVQFHWNGEPTLYPHLGTVLGLFKHCIRQFDTNGKLLVEKANEIIDNLEILTISVIQDDLENYEQAKTVEYFQAMKGDTKPQIVFRLLGNIPNQSWYEKFPNAKVVKRVLHSPDGSFDYEKEVVKPEHGICLDLLEHLAIDRYGNVSPCVRFDPECENIIGNLNEEGLMDIWNGDKRAKLIQEHVEGKRPGFCSKCDYYGIPRG